MKRQTLLVITIIIIVIGATAGGVYYFTRPDSTAPQEVEPEATIQQEPDSTTSQNGDPTSTTPQEEPSPSTPASAPWIITKISEATTVSTLSARVPSAVDFTLTPKGTDEIFLLVEFELNVNNETESLDLQDVLLIVDEIHDFHPVCLPDIFGNFNGPHYHFPAGMTFQFSDWSSSSSFPHTAVNFIGTITSEETSFEIVVDDGSGGSLTVSWQTTSTGTLTFVYVLPHTYLDAKHNLQLRISDSTEGIEFTVEPPPSAP